jgi:hypothetical protein
MGRVRVYLKTFDPSGNYLSSYTDISRDVLKVSTIAQSLDNPEYDVGIFRNGSVKISVRNDHGRFGPAGGTKSMFYFKRADSLIKITWTSRENVWKCGFGRAYQPPIGEEVTVFEGLLSEVSSTSQIDDQKVDFQILGFESLLDRVVVPFADISDGDLISDIILACLDQPFITQYLTVDAANINPALDQAIDLKASLETKTVKEALESENLLLGSNSVLYIRDGVVYVSDREPSAELMHTFYGQASDNGRENITLIKDFRDGINRVFNYINWRDTALVAEDLVSESLYGTQKKEIDMTVISPSSTAKIDSILEDIRDEFKDPKTEFILQTPMDYETLELYLKDRVSVDYPTVQRSADGQPVPRWGQAVWNRFSWPYGQWSLTISASDRFKIMSREMDLDKEVISYQMRKI